MNKQFSPGRTVAVLTTATFGHSADVIAGLREGNDGNGTHFDFKVFALKGRSGDQILSMMDDIVAGHYFAVVAVGLSATRLAVSGISYRVPKVPIISVGVNSYLDRKPLTNRFYTIKYVERDLAKSLEFLKAARPDVVRIYVPIQPDGVYAPALTRDQYPAWIADELAAAQAAFDTRDLELVPVCLESAVDRLAFIERNAHACQAVLLLEGTLGSDIVDGLKDICTRHRITLFSGDRSAVLKGAALGHTIDFSLLGKRAADYLADMLKHGVEDAHIPVVARVEDVRRPMLNRAEAREQGVDVSRAEKVCVAEGGIII